MLKFCAKSILFCTAVGAVFGASARDPEAARKLLDAAVEMSSAVHPETGVIALLRAGLVYGGLDKKTGIELLQRAFAAVPSLSAEDVRDEYASAIVRAIADLDVRAATELLRQMPKPAQAASSVVRQLLAAKHTDEAMELLALMPEQAEYPFEAASYVMASLPHDDPRRSISFGRATTAYASQPVGPFPQMVERFGKQVPADLRTRAVSLMLRRIQDWKDSSQSFSGNTDDENPEIELHSPPQNDLRELVSVARLFDAAGVDGIIAQRPDIRTVLAGFRKKRKPAEELTIDPPKPQEEEGPFLPPFGIGMADNLEGFQKNLEEYSRVAKQAEKVAEVLKKDPAEAIRMARKLPDSVRAETLAVVAAGVNDRDPALAGSILDSCVLEVEQLDKPATRIPVLIQLGSLYAKRNDPARAHAAFERAFADVVPLWNQDTRADHPNVASRDTWPSTQAVRATSHEAALQLGKGAADLLSGVTVADLAVLARIQLARALLGLPMDIHQINVRWVEKDK